LTSSIVTINMYETNGAQPLLHTFHNFPYFQ